MRQLYVYTLHTQDRVYGHLRSCIPYLDNVSFYTNTEILFFTWGLTTSQTNEITKQ